LSCVLHQVDLLYVFCVLAVPFRLCMQLVEAGQFSCPHCRNRQKLAISAQQVQFLREHCGLIDKMSHGASQTTPRSKAESQHIKRNTGVAKYHHELTLHIVKRRGVFRVISACREAHTCLLSYKDSEDDWQIILPPATQMLEKVASRSFLCIRCFQSERISLFLLTLSYRMVLEFFASSTCSCYSCHSTINLRIVNAANA
jgi:hypothetical protein